MADTMKDTMKEPRPKILVVEDDPNDYELVKTIAIHYGLPINVTSTTAALQTIAGGQLSVIVLDLMRGGPNARDTVDTIAASGAERIPIIVTTGYDNPVLRDYCKSRGWAWISKGSPRFGRLLAESLNELTKSDGESDGEGSGSFSVRPSGVSQLEAIRSMLKEVMDRQQAMDGKFSELAETVEEVLTRMFGPKNRVGGREGGGCADTCKATKSIFDAGKVYVWAVLMGTTGSWALLIWWILGRMTQ
jgi:CheY-like chemotaxis protein